MYSQGQNYMHMHTYMYIHVIVAVLHGHCNYFAGSTLISIL